MIYLFGLLLNFLNPNEINMANSLDWLCYNSETVAIVKVVSVKEEPWELFDYEWNVTINAEIIKIYKGNEPLRKEVIIYSRLTYVGSDKWKDMIGKDVLVFLKDLMCESQCVYGIWDDDRGMISLDSPGNKALTGDFRCLKSKDDIFTYGVDCISKLKNKKAEGYFLEVPFETEAHEALYAGSSCYLIVPSILYPKSTKGMY